MALPALVIPIATTLIGSGVSAGQAVNASKRRKEAEAAADAAAAKMRAINFEDTMAGLQIPMMGAEQSAQKQAQREAMQIQALQEAGGAAVLGGTPGLAAMGAEEDLARQAQIEQLEYARNLELARNRQAISEANINKELGIQGMELAGAQQAAAQAESERQAAIGSAASTIAQAGLDIYSTMPLYKNTGSIENAMNGTVTKIDPKTGLETTFAPGYIEPTKTAAPNTYGFAPASKPNFAVKQDISSRGISSPTPTLTAPPTITAPTYPTPGANLLALPPAMGGVNINAYDPFAAFRSPFSQYTTLQ